MHSCAMHCGIMIEHLLAENEGKTIEFKETIRSLDGIMKTVVAFANSAGGTIIIGIIRLVVCNAQMFCNTLQ